MTARQTRQTASLWPHGRQVITVPAASTDDIDWQEMARCAEVDGEIFFPEKGGSTKGAKLICAGCEVRDQCLQYALENDERFGIYGGLSERERRKLKRQQEAG